MLSLAKYIGGFFVDSEDPFEESEVDSFQSDRTKYNQFVAVGLVILWTDTVQIEKRGLSNYIITATSLQVPRLLHIYYTPVVTLYI